MYADKNDKESQYSQVARRFYRGLTFRMSFGLILFLCAVLIVNYFVVENRGRNVIIQQSDKLNDEIGKTIAVSLREKLSTAESLTRSIAQLSKVLDKTPETFMKVIPEILNQTGMEHMIAGGGIWPEPYLFDKKKARSAFFWARNDEGDLELLDDYNDENGRGYHLEEWYVPAQYLEPTKVYWSKSYRDPHSMEPMVTCSVPIWIQGKFSGVATVDLKLAGLSSFMQAQTSFVGGYAFALDRNNRLLSFPSTDEQRLVQFDVNQYSEEAYPTIETLVEKNNVLKTVQGELQRVSIQYELNQTRQKSQKVELLSQKIAQESDQIELLEAKKIAHIMLETQSPDSFSLFAEHGKRLSILYDPLLKEASAVSVLHLPDIGWKVVVAMPARYTDSVVSQITQGMISLLFILLAMAAFLYLLFFNSVFLQPVNKLTQQIRNLVSREDYVTMLNIKGADELAQLASWFNIRTAQLAETLESLKNRNGELNEARETAEQANRSKNIFLASMSHDIRTPMNAIIGLSDVLKKTNLHKEQSQYVQVIHRSAQSLLSLINDIMDFSKIEANQLDLESISFDFRQVMNDCADVVFFQASEKHLEFVYFISPSVPRSMRGDPNRLRQIILNLATNAVKFTASGRVEVWVEALSQNDHAVQLLIEVRDTGIGLNAKAQQKIFTPFVQADSSTTRKYGGTGLGLTISKHLTELMGGSIDFRSEEGVGTTFSLKLKLTKDAQGVIQIPQAAEFNSNVFVLGQNHFQNTVLENYLYAMGCSVTVAGSVQTWLDFLSVEDNRQCVTICTDCDLLGDLNQLQHALSVYTQCFKFLCFSNQNDRHELNLDDLWEQLNVGFITQPMKLDNIQTALSDLTTKQAEKSTDTLNKQSEVLAPLSQFKHKKLLVVEDNKVNQQVLMIMLGYLGLSADLANDGVEAVDAIQSQDYDLVLMDWQMPRMDGLEATRKVRIQKDIKQPVIVAVTANAMSGDIEKCLAAGMNDYLSKPIEKEKLEIVLRRCFSS